MPVSIVLDWSMLVRILRILRFSEVKSRPEALEHLTETMGSWEQPPSQFSQVDQLSQRNQHSQADQHILRCPQQESMAIGPSQAVSHS